MPTAVPTQGWRGPQGGSRPPWFQVLGTFQHGGCNPPRAAGPLGAGAQNCKKGDLASLLLPGAPHLHLAPGLANYVAGSA